MASIINNLEDAISRNLSASDVEAYCGLISILYCLCNDSRLGQDIRNPVLTTSFPYVSVAVNLINASGLTSGQKAALVSAISSPV